MPTNPHTATILSQLSVGMLLMTRDGAPLGHVKEILGEYFKVDAPRKRDYWLSVASVHECAEDVARLDFVERELDLYKLPGPSGTVTTSPRDDAAMETFASPEEQARRREEMMRPYREPPAEGDKPSEN